MIDLPNDLIDKLSPTILRAALEVALLMLSILATFSAGLLITRAKQFFKSIEENIADIRDNHLKHIEENTNQTVALLTEMRDDQKEMNDHLNVLLGYLRGKFE